jgi:hypothetical protein
MGIAEDRIELNNLGIRGMVQKLLRDKQTTYVLELQGGWRGEIVGTKPLLGTGSFLYVRPGFPVLCYQNVTLKEQPTEFRVDV